MKHLVPTWHACKAAAALLTLCLASPIASAAQAGTFALPLDRTNSWQFLKYRKITPNSFRCTPAGFVIGVTNSAAPAVFPLTDRLRVVELKVSGSISGSLNVPSDKQGQTGFDDYALRVGLVQTGTQTLNLWERILAADWVKRLFAIAPRGTGIGGIQFFNIGTEANQIGRSRKYSGDVSMEQTVEAVPDAKGHFSFAKRFEPPLNVVAVWISCDGDDTHSRFSTTIERIELETIEHHELDSLH